MVILATQIFNLFWQYKVSILMNYLTTNLGLEETDKQEAYKITRHLACLNFIGIPNNWQSADKTLTRYFEDFNATDDLNQKEYIVDKLTLFINKLLQTLVDRGYLEKLHFEWGDLADPIKHATSDSAFILVDPSSIVATQVEWMLIDEQDIDCRRSLTRSVRAEMRERSRVATLDEKENIIELARLFMEQINALRRDIKGQFLEVYRKICLEDRRNDDHIEAQFMPLPDPKR